MNTSVENSRSYYEKVRQFDTIDVSIDSVTDRRIRARIDADRLSFNLYFDYDEDVPLDERVAGMIASLPVVNYAYFTREIRLNFPVSESFLHQVREFVRINNIETFINSIVRRRYEFFRKQYLPCDNDITQENAEGHTLVSAKDTYRDNAVKFEPDRNMVAVMSSGGKESLTTFGMLREIGAEVFPVFFNESGGHWKTAKVAYDYMKKNYSNVHRVWSNVDRFYAFMNRNMPMLDQREIRKTADSYPIQMFIFPVYVFSMLPYILKYGIGNIALGDEFDDPLYQEDYRGIRHFYGVYDQTNEFNDTVSDLLARNGMPVRVFSAVYPIFGTLVEKILVNRYPELLRVQRSCHLCHYEGNEVVPCGRCTKCLGVLLFMINAGADPTVAGYRPDAVRDLRNNLESANMRLDPVELEYLKRSVFLGQKGESHVEGIHLIPGEDRPFASVPDQFRDGVMRIIAQYASGIYRIDGGSWRKIRAQ
ncbi:metal-binding protein [Thermoplasma sp.]|uniref:metal-binding protein n=1 Tax=Thermoplasma sp. TaxID=1973142 RepID=UPI00127F0B68|nr:metal-binding protein [Thermoplasma sp.]KAA8922395.1 MAG: metal-binding protein [Thermoplasma sp.]